jgi:hypothetical protein
MLNGRAAIYEVQKRTSGVNNGVTSILMKQKLLFVLLGLIASTGCSGPARPSQVFREAELARYKGRGASTIQGKAFLTEWDGHVIAGEGYIVQLTPATAYTRERFALARDGEDLPVDPALEPYVREAVTNSLGRFSFKNLPQGEYLLVAWITWSVPAAYDTHDRVSKTKQVFATAIVADGETVRVDITG